MKFSLVLLVGLSLTASAQECRQATVTSQVKAGQAYSQQIGTKIEFRLAPLKKDWVWIVSVSPNGSHDDWTFPANLPLRTGESQVLGTGYGSTARDKLSYPHRIQFVITAADYRKYSERAYQTLESPRAEAAGEYISSMRQMPVGYITVQALDYDKSESPETVEWMRFKASFIVPKSFEGAPALSWSTVRCPVPQY
jgi:hypothetical protein